MLDHIVLGVLLCKLITWLTTIAGVIGYLDQEAKVDEKIHSAVLTCKNLLAAAWRTLYAILSGLASTSRGQRRRRKSYERRREIEEYSVGELIFSLIWSPISASFFTLVWPPLGIFLWFLVVINYVIIIAYLIPLIFVTILSVVFFCFLIFFQALLLLAPIISRGEKKKYVSGSLLVIGVALNFLC